MVTTNRLRKAPRLLPRLASLAVWGMAFGCAVYWGLQVSGPAPMPAAVAASGLDASADPKAVGRLLGQADATAAAPTAAPRSRYDLLGVLRRDDGRLGAAVIAVDGRPARTVVVGRHVGEADAGVTLSELGERSATLSVQDGAPIQLQMPALGSPYAASSGSPASVVTPPARQTTATRAAPSPARVAQNPAPVLKPSFVPAGQSAPVATTQSVQAPVRQPSRFAGQAVASAREMADAQGDPQSR